MSFGNALNFPFSSNNINKILQIGIALGVIIALQIVLNFGQPLGLGNLFGFVGNLLFGLFISGYGIRVMQNVMRNNENLPEFEISDSIGRGVKILLASLVYIVPLVVVIIVMLALMGPAIGNVFSDVINQSSYGYTPPSMSSTDSSVLPLLCGSFAILIPIIFIVSFAIQMGMLRYAVEDRSGALFEFGTNIGMVFNKFGTIFKLFLHYIAIWVIYFIIGIVLGFVVVLFAGTGVNSAGANLGIFAIIILVIFNIVTTVLNTAQQMSNLHLLANTGVELGLVEGKFKNDGTMDTSYEF